MTQTLRCQRHGSLHVGDILVVLSHPGQSCNFFPFVSRFIMIFFIEAG